MRGLIPCVALVAAFLASGCDFGCEDVVSEVFDDVAVAEHAGEQTGNILAIGDSFLEWHAEDQASIPDVVGMTLGRTVRNEAVSGARFDQPIACAAEEGYDIPGQYYSGGWDWVIITGGGNDANSGCECGECDALVDRLISADGLQGQIPDFARAIVDAGSRVMWVGYYPMRDDASYGFERCNDELEQFNARLFKLADAYPGIWFVSAGEVVQPAKRSLYDRDRVHPSVDGAELIGELVATAIVDAEAAGI